MKLLAFDTSTERLAIAVAGPTGEHKLVAPGGALASATLLPQVQALLQRAGLALAELDAVAFGRGPGAFTGLRTSCAVAQGLGFGLGRPLLPIDSLLIVAEDARAARAPQAATLEVAVVMDARMGEVYAARYRWQGGAWATVDEPALYAPDALAQHWSGLRCDLVAGSALAALPALQAALPQHREVCADEQDRAAALLRLALSAAAAGAGIDAAAALPVYLRDKVALTTAEREAARALAAASRSTAG